MSKASTMTCRGYTARIEFDNADRIFFGRLLGIRDIVSFHGESVADLEAAFQEAVEDYLIACKKLGQEPNKPASGRIMLRLPKEDHAAALVAAQGTGMSLNKWAAKVIREAAHS